MSPLLKSSETLVVLNVGGFGFRCYCKQTPQESATCPVGDGAQDSRIAGADASIHSQCGKLAPRRQLTNTSEKRRTEEEYLMMVGCWRKGGTQS